MFELVKRSAATAAIMAVAVLLGCGADSSPTTPTTPPPPPPAPTASVEAMGNGNIVLHPSIDPTFVFAIEFPLRIRETAGGSATWNFFRVSYFRGGAEIERAEIGADAIRELGFSSIAARSTSDATVIIRNNVASFDDIDLILGFTDRRDGRQFQVNLSLAVLVSFVPAVIPDGSRFSIVSGSTS